MIRITPTVTRRARLGRSGSVVPMMLVHDLSGPARDFLLSPLFGKLVMICGGLLFAVVGGSGVVHEVRRTRRAVKVPGVVVELRPGIGGGSSTTSAPKYAPVLAFRTRDGRDVQTEGDEASNPPAARPCRRSRDTVSGRRY
ncbi:MAG: DUF3592 domain-containing protein [Streptosporangiaceae bacterium]